MSTIILSQVNCQYEFGLDIESLDAKITGKLFLNSGNRNIAIGENAGISLVNPNNLLIGINTGMNTDSGDGNIFIGNESGFANTSGRSNTFLGTATGNRNTTGSSNVFIGINAGFHETGSNKLYIETAFAGVADNTNPLIYGEFDNNKVEINGSMKISEFALLQPREDPPSSPATGTIYYSSTDNKVKVWTGDQWENLN